MGKLDWVWSAVGRSSLPSLHGYLGVYLVFVLWLRALLLYLSLLSPMAMAVSEGHRRRASDIQTLENPPISAPRIIIILHSIYYTTLFIPNSKSHLQFLSL